MYFYIAEKAKKMGFWQLAKEAAKASSGFINSFYRDIREHEIP
jgi:hypothetical protein